MQSIGAAPSLSTCIENHRVDEKNAQRRRTATLHRYSPGVAPSAAAAAAVAADGDDLVEVTWSRDADTFATMQLVAEHDLID